MAENISLFPTLNQKLRSRIRFQPSCYNFFYTRENLEYDLIPEEIEGNMSVLKLTDSEGIWTPDDYAFHIGRAIELKSYQVLFGSNGIVCSNAKLGLALVWKSAESKQRGVVQIGEIENNSNDLHFRLDFTFSKGQLRGELELSTILYIKKKGIPNIEEEHLANEPGCVLGEFDQTVIKLDGKGSMFPIYEVIEPKQPLWFVKCEWEDPTRDAFSECASICLNKAHRNYNYIDKTKTKYDEQLLKEIMATSIMVIICKLKEDNNYWEDTIQGTNLERGSVSEAVYYFVNTLGWDISTPENMSLTIRKFFDQRM